MAASAEIVAASLQHISVANAAVRSTSVLSSSTLNHVCVFNRAQKRSRLPLPCASAAAGDSGPGQDGSGSRRSASSRIRGARRGAPIVAPDMTLSSTAPSKFFLPEIPYSIITEIEKTVPTFLEKDEDRIHHEEVTVDQSQLQEKEHEHSLHEMIPRCTWPRVKTARGGPEEGAKDAQSPAIPAGPRCAWPRDGVQAISSLSKLAEEEANVVEARNGSAIGNGPKCAWPRHRISAASSTKVISASSMDPSTSQSSPGRGKPLSDPPPAIEGPRCAWPRSTTARRVLATSIGLGLLNSFFIDQGATAFAILLQSPPSSTSKMPGEDDDTLSSYSHRLLP